jgi:hypothetical protein
MAKFEDLVALSGQIRDVGELHGKERLIYEALMDLQARLHRAESMLPATLDKLRSAGRQRTLDISKDQI